jgi:hypothetical protein
MSAATAQDAHAPHDSGERSQLIEIVVFVLLLGAGGYALFGPKSPPSSHEAEATAAATSKSKALAATSASGRRRMPPSAASAMTGRGLEEMQFMQGARRSLSQGNADEALKELGTYESRFPGGRLADDVTMMRAEAYLRKGDRAAAKKLADQLTAKNPESRQAKRANALMNGETPPAPGGMRPSMKPREPRQPLE